MIRELRLHHRRMIPVLGILSVGVFVAALLARKPIPENESVTLENPTATVPAGAEIHSLPFGPLSETLEASLHQVGSQVVLSMNVTAPVRMADPLVYWSPSDMKEAQLLGPLPSSGRRSYTLNKQSGSVIIYSLARQEILDQAKFSLEDSL